MASKLARALGRKVTFQDVPFAVYRGLGFPGAEDLGNMFEYHAILGERFYADRDPAKTRELNPMAFASRCRFSSNCCFFPGVQ